MLIVALLWGGCGKKDEFVSKEGSFAVAATGIVTQKKQTVSNQEGQVDIYTLTFALKEPSSEYWIVYIDYPDLTVRNKGGPQLLNDARDGSISNVGGRLLAEQKVFLREYPGLEIDYEGRAEDVNSYKSRIYLVNQRLYVLLVTSPKDQPFSRQALTFLDSFRLL